MSRKIKQYVKHCSFCELNQIKRYASYDELISITTKRIFSKTVAINFIVTLSKNKNDFILISICKVFKRVNLIFEIITWTIEQWTNVFLDRLLITNWRISKNIISNKNFKVISKFWIAIFKHFETILLLLTTYHFQTNEQSKKINQTIEITFRYFVTEFPKNDWIETLSLI